MRFCNSTLLTRTRAGFFYPFSEHYAEGQVSSLLHGSGGWRAGMAGVGGRPLLPVTLDPRCRSRPMLIAVTVSRNSGAGSRTGPNTMRPCASAAT